MEDIERYTFNNLLSYNRGVFYFADTTRNVGKTWALQISSWRRAYKHDKKVILIRRTKKEAIKAAQDLYTSPKLISLCKGIKIYDPTTKKGNFKRVGRKFFIKRNGRWEWFLQVIANSECKDCRGFSDERCDRIFFDEYITTSKRRAYYQGNEVEDLIDLLISVSRQHRIKVIFFGNKEDTENPYYNYFNIPMLPVNYSGIRSFKKGTLIVQQYNKIIYDDKTWLNDLKDLLKGTPYGDFMFESQYKNSAKVIFKPTPKDTDGYCQYVWLNTPLRVSIRHDIYYVDNKVDYNFSCLVDTLYTHIKHQQQLNKKEDRNKFRGWQRAFLQNRVIYANQKVYDATQKLMKWFGVTNT